ncbi:hypothetical protein [Glycomyces salinus]|uniref:hypothetical protein n=1 Tax=Glycomyces salinus TaxID=980294 RepID=UPI0018EB825D|nr:hypothetical protein [Glycomyces salinus]
MPASPNHPLRAATAATSGGRPEGTAFGALRFYSMWGPVELRLADGRTFGIGDLTT